MPSKKCGGMCNTALRLACVPHVIALAFPTMTLNSTSDSASIFENGRLKPRIYNIQNLHLEADLDVHRHSNELCCRPARNLEDGGGLVRLSLSTPVCVSDG